jgi:pimeloyl-ACP methyl ester carboxylesterase/tetratricopeptide (TPR) repeat protein
MQLGDATRGKARDLLVKFIRVIRSDPTDLAGEVAAHLLKDLVILRNFEQKLVPNPGIYHVGPGFTLQPETRALDNTAPYLLFIHGTASNTQGGFGSIVAGKNVGLSINPPQTEEWRAIKSIYGDRMIAFEHPTLSVSPIENAIELARALPSGARLHLVTHSRGGLVGELLCLERPPQSELDRMRQRGRGEDAERLQELCTITEARKFQVDRFVRVACPASGTILASGRVDTYLTVIFNLLKLIQPLSANPVFAFLEAAIRETAKLRTDPNQLPGLEAMMPESPLIRLLNTKGQATEGQATQADLGVIAGDVEGEGILGTLKILAANLFYQEDHDLVVNTSAMYGGIRRAKGASFYFERGPEVNHFNYFGNSSTRGRLLEWLKGETRGFQKIERSRVPAVPAPSRGADNNPVLFLIPGFMGSNIGEGEGRIWYDFDRLAKGAAANWSVANPPADPALSVIGREYQAITSYLEATHAVKLFPYDWRQSVAKASERLDAAIQTEGKDPSRPIRILAHSQGALVALHYIATHPDDWQQIIARKGRLVMLGAPLRGTFTAVLHILGRDRFTRMLSLLDDGQTPYLKQIVGGWPGLLELLPRPAGATFFAPAFWQTAGDAPVIDAQILADARTVTEQIDAAMRTPPGSVVQVLGVADWTVSGLRTNENGAIGFETTSEGDGRITFQGNVIPGRTWYMNACHGDLPDTESAFPAIYDLLENGTTVRLSSEPPSHSRKKRTQPLREERPLFPDEDTLLDAALGKAEHRVAASETRVVRVSVLHADLRNANFPVAVGHYQSDTIVHAEEVLDSAFDKALSARFQMGVYPGRQRTSEVILRPKGARPPGALIVGLGQVGEVTADTVRQGVLDASLKHAMAVLETRQPQGSFLSAAFSTLLIGTFGTRGLTVEESVAAILQAAMEANRALRAQGLWNKVRVDAVQFVELYEETAIQAVHAAASSGLGLRIFLEDGEALDVDDNLNFHPSGRLQAPSNQYETGWWRRLEITSQPGETPGDARTLRFKLLTDRARTENISALSQKEIIDELVERAISSTTYDTRLASAMFELLWPNELKDKAENRANLLIEVDKYSAQVPWEMMAERTARTFRPLAVEAGLLRQFQTDKFRRAPRMSIENAALVIGDPKLDDPEYPPLPGARQEAELVADVLNRRGFMAKKLIQPEMFDIVTSLFERDYRIVHIAAHGEYDVRGRTGVVISRKRLLTAIEFQQMRVLPDLVFLNCCHLGRIDPKQDQRRMQDMNKLAASVAEQLICDGVRAVVVAGWAVNDSAAFTFAERLYEGLLLGENFGTAVLEARKLTYGGGRGGLNTWAAYQCYGNPDFVLVPRGQAAKSTPPVYRSRREFLGRARNIVSEAGGADPDGRDRLRDELRSLEQILPSVWRDGDMLAVFGDAYAKVGAFPDAVRVYKSAVNDVQARSPIVAVERLANLEERHAKELIFQAGRQTDPKSQALEAQARESSEDAIRRLEWLLDLGENSERFSLLGGAYKRRAWAKTGEDRKRDLEKSKEYYGRAARLNPSDTYAPLNEATIGFLLGDKDRQPILDAIEKAKAAATTWSKLLAHEQDIWKRVALPDALLFEAIVSGKLVQQVDEIVSL